VAYKDAAGWVWEGGRVIGRETPSGFVSGSYREVINKGGGGSYRTKPESNYTPPSSPSPSQSQPPATQPEDTGGSSAPSPGFSVNIGRMREQLAATPQAPALERAPETPDVITISTHEGSTEPRESKATENLAQKMTEAVRFQREIAEVRKSVDLPREEKTEIIQAPSLRPYGTAPTTPTMSPEWEQYWKEREEINRELAEQQKQIAEAIGFGLAGGGLFGLGLRGIAAIPRVGAAASKVIGGGAALTATGLFGASAYKHAKKGEWGELTLEALEFGAAGVGAGMGYRAGEAFIELGKIALGKERPAALPGLAVLEPPRLELIEHSKEEIHGKEEILEIKDWWWKGPERKPEVLTWEESELVFPEAARRTRLDFTQSEFEKWNQRRLARQKARELRRATRRARRAGGITAGMHEFEAEHAPARLSEDIIPGMESAQRDFLADLELPGEVNSPTEAQLGLQAQRQAQRQSQRQKQRQRQELLEELAPEEPWPEPEWPRVPEFEFPRRREEIKFPEFGLPKRGRGKASDLWDSRYKEIINPVATAEEFLGIDLSSKPRKRKARKKRGSSIFDFDFDFGF